MKTDLRRADKQQTRPKHTLGMCNSALGPWRAGSSCKSDWSAKRRYSRSCWAKLTMPQFVLLGVLLHSHDAPGCATTPTPAREPLTPRPECVSIATLTTMDPTMSWIVVMMLRKDQREVDDAWRAQTGWCWLPAGLTPAQAELQGSCLTNVRS